MSPVRPCFHSVNLAMSPCSHTFHTVHFLLADVTGHTVHYSVSKAGDITMQSHLSPFSEPGDDISHIFHYSVYRPSCITQSVKLVRSPCRLTFHPPVNPVMIVSHTFQQSMYLVTSHTLHNSVSEPGDAVIQSRVSPFSVSGDFASHTSYN